MLYVEWSLKEKDPQFSRDLLNKIKIWFIILLRFFNLKALTTFY